MLTGRSAFVCCGAGPATAAGPGAEKVWCKQNDTPVTSRRSILTKQCSPGYFFCGSGAPSGWHTSKGHHHRSVWHWSSASRVDARSRTFSRCTFRMVNNIDAVYIASVYTSNNAGHRFCLQVLKQLAVSTELHTGRKGAASRLRCCQPR